MEYFNAFWSLYPRRLAKKDAERAASKINGEWPQIMEGLKKYLVYWKQHDTDKKYIPYPATFLNKRRWEDEIETQEEAKQETALDILLKNLQNKNNKTMPDLPPDVKQAFFRMKIPWARLQLLSDEEVTKRFENCYADRPIIIEDRMKKAAGEKEE